MFQSVLQESPSPSRDAQWFGLTQDFLHNAVTYGKIIISETFIPTRSKTIPPVSSNNSGDECYEVYIHKGILYKLYLDTQKNFGSTHHAMKVASNEMKGLRSLLKCSIAGLYFPFSIQIDFQGFRLLAQSGIVLQVLLLSRHLHLKLIMQFCPSMTQEPSPTARVTAAQFITTSRNLTQR